jgi:hypothetical protein
VLCDNQRRPARIALDDAFVYFQSESDGAVARVSKTGGAAEPVVPGRVELGFHVDGAHVYYLSDGVKRVPKGGGASELVASSPVPGDSPSLLAADDGHVYFTWMTSSGFAFVTHVGVGDKTPDGGATELFTTTKTIASLSADDVGLYFTEWQAIGNQAPEGNVVAASKQPGSAVRTLATSQGKPTDVTTDGASVYFANVGAGTVKRVAKAGGDPQVIAPGRFLPHSPAVSATTIFWADEGAGRVMACPITGCGEAARTLAEDQGSPVAVAVDEVAVYWVNVAGGTVMKIAK